MHDFIDLAELPRPDAEPQIHDSHGAIAAPRPAWAMYAQPTSHAGVTYHGPGRDVDPDPHSSDYTVVEVRADLAAFAGPAWVEWTLSEPEIHVVQTSTRYTIQGARRLAAALLELADEIENGARS